MEDRNTAVCNPVAATQGAIVFLHELDRALHDFLQWQHRLYRGLVSEGTVTADDLADDSHLRCAFGRWLTGLPPEIKARDAALADIDQLHERMHEAARRMLQLHVRHEPIAAPVFDAFVDLALDFKQALLKYQRRIISEVCTLDPLTGAGNRYAMDLRLTEEWERSRRSGLPCSLAMLDLDHFKEVNDTHGHAVGDTVLRLVSRFLKGEGRIYDNLFRYGGEEFLICMPNTPLDLAQSAANRLREGIAGLSIPLAGGASLHITASFGVSLLLTDQPIEQSVEHADHALFCAKSNGRDRVCVWDLSRPVRTDG